MIDEDGGEVMWGGYEGRLRNALHGTVLFDSLGRDEARIGPGVTIV